jgi:hypothetical protein
LTEVVNHHIKPKLILNTYVSNIGYAVLLPQEIFDIKI